MARRASVRDGETSMCDLEAVLRDLVSMANLA